MKRRGRTIRVPSRFGGRQSCDPFRVGFFYSIDPGISLRSPRLLASMPSVSWGLVFFLLPTADWLGAASRESPGDHHIRPSRLRLIQPLYLSLHGPHPAARGIRPSLVVH